MKATMGNIIEVFNVIKANHLDNMVSADFAFYDDETDLLSALEDAVKHVEQREANYQQSVEEV